MGDAVNEFETFREIIHRMDPDDWDGLGLEPSPEHDDFDEYDDMLKEAA